MTNLTLFWVIFLFSLRASVAQTNEAITRRTPEAQAQNAWLLTPSAERLQSILHRREILLPSRSNRLDTIAGRFGDYRGVLVQLHRTSYNPIHLLNPFAPVKYGGLPAASAIPVSSLPWTVRAAPPLPWSFNDPRTHEAELMIFSISR